ncbi:MAG: DUF2075 domain-containing protein [Bacilli bacterium]|jgi:uncharacterized protein
MIVYHQTKAEFDRDVLDNCIADKVKAALKEHGYNDNNEREFRSWQNSLVFMRNALIDKEIPDDVDVSIEYQIPQTSKRVDFIITGSDENDQDNIVIVELKQWQKAKKIDDVQMHSVLTEVGGGERSEAHPSYQAYSYSVLIKNYSKVVEDFNIKIEPCAYLHNYDPNQKSVLSDPIYKTWYEQAPFFIKNEREKLTNFIKKFIFKKSKNGDLLYKIEGGRIRPAKALQDCLSSMLKGNKEFSLIDDQIVIYDKCVRAMIDTNYDKEKRVIIIQGGPGTGKSVLAVNLLCDLLKRSNNVAYITKNSAPRNCYLNMLAKDDELKKVSVKTLFKSPFGLCKLPRDSYDCLIIDEAHRLVEKMYGDWGGENQIKECIDASRLTIFLIDEDQRITTKDIGSVDAIKEIGHQLGVLKENIYCGDEYVLKSQFRCNGSDGYIAFIDDLLEKKETANHNFDIEDFDFRVYDDPIKFRNDLRELNKIKNKARMVAGYCYDWNVKFGRSEYDISLENDFKAKWNAEADKVWAINPGSFENVGCIHTCQGLEFDYVGVIIGKDLLYRNGHVITNKEAISKDDKSSGIRSCKNATLADTLIKNTYKVLLTRGQKGCFIYCEDKELSNYIKSRITK